MENPLKNSKLYKYFAWHFKSIDSKQEDLKKRIDNIEKSILDLTHTVQAFQNKLEHTKTGYTFSDVDLTLINDINERTKQFEYINTELFKLKPVNKCKILLVGFYGAPNTGDELMLQALLNILDCEKNDVTVMLSDNPYYQTIKKYHVNYIHYPKTNLDLDTIAQYFDKIIFGGGAILDDFEYDKNYAYKYNVANILMDLSIKAIYEKKELYCIGLSSNSSLTNLKYIRDLEFIIKNSTHFSLRDNFSKKTLIDANVEGSNNIEVINDIAYALPNFKHNIDKSSLNIGLVLIGFADINKLLTIIQDCDNFIKDLYNHKDVKITLIPFYDYNNSDLVEYNRIISQTKLNCPFEILQYEHEYEKIMNQINTCDILVCMRYHSSLLALKSGIPSVHIVYDIHRHYENKMNDLKSKYGYDNTYISFKNLKENDVTTSLKFVLDNYNEIHEKNIEISSELETLTTNYLSKILK